MSKVTFIPENLTVEVSDATTILQAARLLGIAIESPCNEGGTCGKCRVKLVQGGLPDGVQRGKHQLDQVALSQGYVLACQTRVTGEMVVEIPCLPQNNTLQILNDGVSCGFELHSAISKQYWEKMQKTLVYAADKLIGTEPGNTAKISYGLVVDIGTTTLVAALVDLISGMELGSVSGLNPQAAFAQDVLSRIKMATEKEGLAKLSRLFHEVLNRMIAELAQHAGIHNWQIYEVVFSGNTCMLHLAVEQSPASLGKYPYTPVVTGGKWWRSRDLHLDIAEFGLVYLPPVISAYVGADISSGIVASQLEAQPGASLFVDIGTNGEMVLAVDGRLTATSTAAGPAFEGMSIAFGMRAAAGAIESFAINGAGQVELGVIGNGEAIGICGSGLLDLAGELVMHGIIDHNGRLATTEKLARFPELQKRLVQHDGKPAFQLSETVVLTQKDIRQVQLAKGAIRAGIEALLERGGITAATVDRVLIAGSFGYHLRTKNLINTGLLPPEFAGKVTMIGNTSKTGGRALLLNTVLRKKITKLVKTIEVLELANCVGFDRKFLNCLGF